MAERHRRQVDAPQVVAGVAGASDRLLEGPARLQLEQRLESSRRDVGVERGGLVERFGGIVEHDPTWPVDERRELGCRDRGGHGNGWGYGFTSDGASGAARSPSSKAASYSRLPPRNRAPWATSSAQSSGATTLVTTSPSSATSGEVTRTAWAD